MLKPSVHFTKQGNTLIVICIDQSSVFQVDMGLYLKSLFSLSAALSGVMGALVAEILKHPLIIVFAKCFLLPTVNNTVTDCKNLADYPKRNPIVFPDKGPLNFSARTNFLCYFQPMQHKTN